MNSNFSNKTKLAIELIVNNGYTSGSGSAERGKDYCTDFIMTYDKNEKLSIPYDAYKLIDIAKELLYKADTIINENKNIGE